MTRLGQGVDASGRLGDEPIARTLAVVDRYRDRIEALGADAAVAVLTSAVRDAANGADLTGAVAERGFEARTITGDEEAALTFRGATSERAGREELVVIDIGGGSTELVTGHGPDVDFHVSMQAGVVRLGERHLHDDPPDPDEVASLVEDFRATLAAQLPDEVARSVQAAIAVAGTPTSAAAIELELDPYDPARVHGHVLELATLEEQLAFLAAMPLEQRREVTGLHPDRAPTIVAGVAMLMECVRAFGLERVEVSEHDILRGAALARADADRHRRSRCQAKAKPCPSPFLGIAFPAGPAETTYVERGTRFRARHHRFGRSRIVSAPPAVRTIEKTALSRHVPLPVLTGPSLEAALGRLPAVQGRSAISRIASATASGASSGTKWPTSSRTRRSTSSKSRSSRSVQSAANSGSRVLHSAMTGNVSGGLSGTAG